MRLENRVSLTGKTKCFETSFQHTSGWKQIPWLFVPSPHQPCCFLHPFAASLHQPLSFPFAFKHVNVSLMLPYEACPTSHLLPSLSFLLFLPPSVFQLLEQTVPWHTFLAVHFHEYVSSVLYLLCGLPAQHWVSPSWLLFTSWAWTAWRSRIKAMFHSLVLQELLTKKIELLFIRDGVYIWECKLNTSTFLLLHRSRD